VQCPSNRHRSHESTHCRTGAAEAKATKLMGAKGQCSVSSYFVTSWLSISGLGSASYLAAALRMSGRVADRRGNTLAAGRGGGEGDGGRMEDRR
jgi:hypothetical protein